MADVLVRNAVDGSFQNLSIAAVGAVVAAPTGGLEIVAGAVGIKALTAGKGIALNAGVLSVVESGEGVPTAIATVGAGVLTAAAINSGLIMRSGPIGAYNDTTDTAAAILALMDDPAIGSNYEFTIVNGVAFALTMVAGVGVTLAGVTAVAASTVRRYRLHVTNVVAPAVTITGIGAETA